MTAELMEQTSKENRVHITKEVYEKIEPWFELEEDDREENDEHPIGYYIIKAKMDLDKFYDIVTCGSSEEQQKLEFKEDEFERIHSPPFQQLLMALKISEEKLKSKGTKEFEDILLHNLEKLEKLTYEEYQRTKTENSLALHPQQSTTEKNSKDLKFDSINEEGDISYESNISSAAEIDFKPPRISILTLLPKKLKEKVNYYKSTYAHQSKSLVAMGLAIACNFTLSTLLSTLSYLHNPEVMYSATLIVFYVLTSLVW
eukprot:CAMPEP_0117418318 /NCGR_PEP_ID=MMETSP0758-20121206/127_1 /TAXON_ID=63605 /ORGANISM="Percolomonas cosmopolitus, Strain AE-1 (ATCC 50343)" /LENGTH=257 /DNA_ID=CAMNT_0005198757 /DNA_START=1318 /DNA_END=2088 /DNA_ORIENTATION=-